MLLTVPHDTELEQYVLGCILYEPRCFADIEDVFNPRFFYSPKHVAIAKAIQRIWSEDPQSLSYVAVAQDPEVRAAHVAPSELTQYASSVPSVEQVRWAAEKLRDIAIVRALVELGHEMTQKYDLRDTDEIRRELQRFEAKLARISEVSVQNETTVDMPDAVEELNRELYELMFGEKKGVTGIPSGYPDLDNLTCGFQPGDLVILAARPSMGKTALAVNFALNMALEGLKVLFISAEMRQKNVVRRMVSNLMGIDSKKLRTGQLSEEEYQRYLDVAAILKKLPIRIDDQKPITVPEIRAKARKMKRERGLDCIIIDYLGFIDGDRSLSRYDLVSQNCRDLKALAGEFNVPVICLAQLNREVEKRNDKRPILSDLRDTGEIEQTADLVMFLYRADYYEHEEKGEPEKPGPSVVEVIIAKQRDGAVGTVKLLFKRECGRFLSMSRRSDVG